MGETYLDYHFGVADISRCIKAGENKVEVIVDVFHVVMELDAIYIKGEFSVIEKDGKWILSQPQAITYGAWKNQGLTFYPYAVQYEYEVKMDTVPKATELDLGSYEATAVSMNINGYYAGLLHADGKRAADITSILRQNTTLRMLDLEMPVLILDSRKKTTSWKISFTQSFVAGAIG